MRLRIKQDQRGISNVIVVMLSLVILVTVVANVVLWSYQMNQLDWERMQENVEIVDVARVTSSSWFVPQNEYTVNIGSHVSGTYTDTQAIDNQYERFTEPLPLTYYPNGYNIQSRNWWDQSYGYRKKITITNNVGSTLSSSYPVWVTTDTASLVTAGKMRSDGNDLRIVYWNSTGSSWLELDRDVIDINSSSTQVWFKTQANIGASSSDNNYYMYYGCSSAASPPSNKSEVYLYWADFEDGTQGWATSGYNYNWERDSEENLVGFPLPGSWNNLGWEPTEAHGGTYLWGTDIGAPYPDDNNQYGYLNSPAIDLTNAQGDVTLRYWLAYNVEGAGYDSFRVEIDDNSGFTSPTAIEIVGETGGYIYDIQQNWYEDTYDITSYKGGYLYMRVGFESDSGWRFGGVYVDDVNIRQSVSPEPSTYIGSEEPSYYVSGTVPGSIQTIDSDYLIIKSAESATATLSYNPSGYTLGGSTTLVSGSVSNLTSDDGVYMTFRSQGGGGLNWFLNSDSKVYTPTVGSWQDVDVSADTDIPAGATGLVLEIVNENATTAYIGQVRATGSTDNRTSGAKIRQSTQIMAFVKLDANKKFQAYRDNTAIKFYVRGYTDSSVTLFTNWNDVAGGHTAYTWYTVDVSGYGVPANSIIILELYNHNSNTYTGLRFRRNGDTDYATYGQAGTVGAHQFIMVGVDANSKFQHHKSNNDYGNFYLVGYIENVGTWRASPSGDVSGTTTGVWTDIDITAETSSNAVVALIYARCGWVSEQPKKADFRKNGSSDDQYSYGEHWYDLPASSIFYVVGLDENQILKAKIEASAINVYVVGYLEPTLEVEFIGSSNTYEWTQLEWTIDSAWTVGSVSVTFQLYNYSLGGYPTSGNGYIGYTSSATANTDETKSQIITINPTHFRNATGYWKLKVKGVKATATQFDFKADWIEFQPTYYSEYTVSTEFVFSGMTAEVPTQLNFTIVSEYDIESVNVVIQVWNYSSSAYVTSGEGYLTYTSTGTNVTKVLSVNINPQFYTSDGYAKIKVTGVKSTTTQFQQKTNQIKLDYKLEARLDLDGAFVIDMVTYPLAYIQSVEIRLRYKADDAGEKWYLKAYNWTAMTYGDNGFNSTLGHMPTMEWDNYVVNLTNHWRSYVREDGTVHVKLCDGIADDNQTTIDIDFLAVRVVIDGTCFNFKNKGAVTSHIVSIWINNSTYHQRYDENIFINSGESTEQLRIDMRLPTGNFIVKVVTERGNTAIFSGE